MNDNNVKYISFSDVVLDMTRSNFIYFKENNKIYRSRFKKDYKNNQILVFSVVELLYVDLQLSDKVKDLARKYGIPVMHHRKISRVFGKGRS